MQRSTVITTITVAGIHGVAIVVAGLHGAVPFVQWHAYVVTALAVSAGMSVFLLVPVPQPLVISVIMAQFALLYVIGYPVGTWVLLELLVHCALLVEVVAFTDTVPRAILGVGSIVVMALQQRPVSAWGVQMASPRTEDILSMVAIELLVLASAWVTAEAVVRRRQARQTARHKDQVIQRLVDANMEYQRYALQVEQSTEQNERERITREIHDTVGYAFTSQRMMLEAGPLLLDRDPERLRGLIHQAQNNLNDGYEEVRNSLHRLRKVGRLPDTLDRRIVHLARHFSEVSGVQIRFDPARLPDSLPGELEQSLFRLFQEGITNAFCHGQAHNVTLTLCYRDGFIRAAVLDDGRGSDQVQEGIGFHGMRERLEPLGGTISYRSLSPGFALDVTIPFEENHENSPR